MPRKRQQDPSTSPLANWHLTKRLRLASGCKAEGPSSPGYYSPLKTRASFRLLKVDPGDSALSRSYELFTTSIATARDCYHALSYAWGEAGDEKKITINSQTVWIRRNLFEFLQQLHRMQWTGYLWVDAICIDQSNIAERNQQVKIMHNIYAAAKEVFVWLGLGSTQSDRIFDLSRDGQRMKRTDSGDYDPKGNNLEDIDAMLDIVRRPYWGRIWIVQELARAKRVSIMCGEKIMGWGQMKWLPVEKEEDIKLFVDTNLQYDLIWGREVSNSRRGISDLETWRFIAELFWDFQARPRKYTLLSDLIFMFGRMDCQDKHDRVYALLGLLDSPTEPRRRLRNLDVDYNASLAELFIKTVDFCHRNLEQPDLGLAVDLTVFLQLHQHGSEKERACSIVLHQPLVGTVGQDLEGAYEKMIDPKAPPPGELPSDDLDEWACNPRLVFCATSNKEKVVLDSKHLRTGDKLYALDTTLSCTRFKFRPADCDALVMAVSYDDELDSPVIGVGIWPYASSYDEYIVSNRAGYDNQKLLLLKWRRIVEEELRAAHFEAETSSSGETLAITMTLDTCISLAQALWEVTDEWM